MAPVALVVVVLESIASAEVAAASNSLGFLRDGLASYPMGHRVHVVSAAKHPRSFLGGISSLAVSWLRTERSIMYVIRANCYYSSLTINNHSREPQPPPLVTAEGLIRKPESFEYRLPFSHLIMGYLGWLPKTGSYLYARNP